MTHIACPTAAVTQFYVSVSAGFDIHSGSVADAACGQPISAVHRQQVSVVGLVAIHRHDPAKQVCTQLEWNMFWHGCDFVQGLPAGSLQQLMTHFDAQISAHATVHANRSWQGHGDGRRQR